MGFTKLQGLSEPVNNIWTHLKSDDDVGSVVEILNVADVVMVALVLVNESHDRNLVEILNVADVLVAVLVLVNESRDQNVVVVLNVAVTGDVLLALALLDSENKSHQGNVVH